VGDAGVVHCAALAIVCAVMTAPSPVDGQTSRQENSSPNQSRMSTVPDEKDGESASDDEASESEEADESESAGTEAGGDEPDDEASEDADGPEDPESDDSEASGGEKQSPVEYCNEFIESYSRSSARKLYRALAGQGFDMQKVQLQDWVEVEVRTADGQGEKVEFRVHREKNGRAAGLIDDDREYRRTLLVASTDAGPVVASQTWPASLEVHARGDCRPTSSRIEYPLVATPSVDLEPFKFWGLRIIWRLPKSFEKGAHDRDSLYDTIVKVMSSERTATDE
jgi:hypothetical protein